MKALLFNRDTFTGHHGLVQRSATPLRSYTHPQAYALPGDTDNTPPNSDIPYCISGGHMASYEINCRSRLTRHSSPVETEIA